MPWLALVFLGMPGPNILVVMTDQQKADTLRIYGNDYVKTPTIDALAERGAVIDGHICNYPACTPARATFHTGRYTHTTRVRANHLHLPDREITLPAMLKRSGYEIGLIGKNHVFADGSIASQFRDGALALMEWPRLISEFGPFVEQLRGMGMSSDLRGLFDVWFQADHFGPQGPEWSDLRSFSLRPELWRSHAATSVTPFPLEQTTSAVLGQRTAEFISDRAESDRPWFLWLSFPDPHNPYHAPEPFYSMYDPEKVSIPPHDPLTGKPERQKVGSRMSGVQGYDEALIREATRVQNAMVSAIDDALGNALEALTTAGRLEDTVIVYTTDHGAYVGDHSSWHKGAAFYDCLVRLPLVISWTGTIPARRLSRGFVEQVDIMPTLLDLAGIDIPPGVQGVSIANALTGSEKLRDVAFSEVGEPGEPVGWDDLPFMPEDPLDSRYFGWDGFQEAWVGKGKMIRTEEWKYAWYANGDEELYDLRADADELINHAADEKHASLKQQFRDRLLGWAVATEDDLPLHARNVYLNDVISGNLPF